MTMSKREEREIRKKKGGRVNRRIDINGDYISRKVHKHDSRL